MSQTVTAIVIRNASWLTGGGACDGGGRPLRAARRSSISCTEGTGWLGLLRAASRDSISLSDEAFSARKVKCSKVINNTNKESPLFTWQSVLLEHLESLSNGTVLFTHYSCWWKVCSVASAASVGHRLRWLGLLFGLQCSNPSTENTLMLVRKENVSCDPLWPQ